MAATAWRDSHAVRLRERERGQHLVAALAVLDIDIYNQQRLAVAVTLRSNTDVPIVWQFEYGARPPSPDSLFVAGGALRPPVNGGDFGIRLQREYVEAHPGEM